MIQVYINYGTFTTVSFRNGNLIVLTTPRSQKHAHILGGAFSKAFYGFKNKIMPMPRILPCQEFLISLQGTDVRLIIR